MEQENRVAVVGKGTFLDTAIMDLAEMKVAAQMILDSRLAPDHFYEKNPDKSVNYSKGSVPSVILVCVHGHDLGLKPLVALQHIIPVNGLLSIKGDAAKTLIFNSGKLKPGSWKETITGSIANGDYVCTMTAERLDTKEVMSRTFGVAQAKRAGLWIDEAKIRGNDGWKYQKSAWYKYPERMIAYRALGFLSRDLFPDVLSGSYTTEEAIDMPVDTSLVVQTPGGVEVVVPDPDFNKDRSTTLTTKANDQIDKRSGDLEPKPAEEIHPESQAHIRQNPMTVEESYPEAVVSGEGGPVAEETRQSMATMLNGTPGFVPVYTEEEMKEMDTSELNTLIEHDGLMVKAREIDPGKNTNKKLRTILLAHYKGDTIVLIVKFDPEYQDPLANHTNKDSLPEEQPAPTEPTPAPEPENQPEYEAVMEEQSEEQPEDPQSDPPAEPPIEPNAGFDATAPDPEPQVQGNKFEIEVPELVDGKRGFDQVKTLFEDILNKAGVDNTAYDQMIKSKFPQFQKYRSKEDFCYMGEVAEINTLLNSI